MAVMFPTVLAIYPGMETRPLDTEYKVGIGRVGNDMAVYVYKNTDQAFHRYVSLKRRWWHLNSPADRIRRTTQKAERLAAKLNHAELYISHEADLVEAFDGSS